MKAIIIDDNGFLVSALAEPLGAALGYFILAPFMRFSRYRAVFGIIGYPPGDF